MSTNLINLYRDGIKVNSIATRDLDVMTGDSEIIEVEIKTEQGYETAYDTEITFAGDKSYRYSISEDGVTFNGGLIITDKIDSIGKKLFIKVEVEQGADLVDDTTTNIHALTKVRGVR